MADETVADEAPGPQLTVERIYLRDASFESPLAPEVFARDWQPRVQVDIDTRNRALDDARHEVVLSLTLEAKLGEEVAMIVEVQQAGIFRITGVDDEMRRQALGTACPTVLFPYLRETVDSLAVKGTFPPIMLAPVNFDALYAEAKRRFDSQQAGEGGDSTVD